MNLPPIPNAFENVKNACEQRLTELYPAGIPEQVMQRYQQELFYLQRSNCADEYELYRQLCEESRKCAQYFYPKSNEMSSYLIYLLSRSIINPLPAHYYCSHCGYYESTDSNMVGLDLPPKNCPTCGLPLYADGFNLPLESFWGINGTRGYGFEYFVASSFLPYAGRRIKTLFPDYEVIPLGTSYYPSEEEKHPPTQHTGYVILPKGTTLDDFPELQGYFSSGEQCALSHRTGMLPVGEVIMHPRDQLANLIELQQKTGIYCSDISVDDIRQFTHYDLLKTASLDLTANVLFEYCHPKNYREMISLIAASKDSYVSYEEKGKNASWRRFHHHPLADEYKNHACFTREDLQNKLSELGYSYNTAFNLSDTIRKGHLIYTKPSLKIHQDMRTEIENSTVIPEELKNYIFDCLYLTSRSAATQSTAMIAILAYYQKQDSTIYAEVVLQKSN